MLFKVESRSTGRSTHCGVLEFSADEGMVYMPYWVSRNAVGRLLSTLQCVYPVHTCQQQTQFWGTLR